MKSTNVSMPFNKTLLDRLLYGDIVEPVLEYHIFHNQIIMNGSHTNPVVGELSNPSLSQLTRNLHQPSW